MAKKDKSYSLTIYLIKPNISRQECLTAERATTEYPFTFPDQTDGYLHIEKSAASSPRWLSLLSTAVTNLPHLTTSSASAVLFTSRKGRLFALTFGYGRALLVPGSWEEDFGLKVTLNSVDTSKLRTVDLVTLDAIGQHSRIQASREATIGDFGLDVDQDLLRAVTGKPLDASLGKLLTGKDALSVTLSLSFEKIPALLESYLSQAASTKYKVAFPWIDQIHQVADPDKVAELDTALMGRLMSQNFTRLWLAIPEIIDWTRTEGFKYRDAQNAMLLDDVHIVTFVEEFGVPGSADVRLLKKRNIYAISQETGEVFARWTVYRCLYCEIDLGQKTYLLNNGKWYRVGTKFRDRVNGEFAKTPISTIALPDYKDKSEGEYNSRVAVEASGKYALMDQKLIQCDGYRDKVEFCDLLATTKSIIHVKRYGGSAPLSHLFAQAIVSGTLFKRDADFRKKVNSLVPDAFRPVTEVPTLNEFEVVLAIVSASKKPGLVLPFFSRVNLNTSRARLEDLGYRVSLAKIQGQ
jgi:uncharacterized protein (TIGR04141 family)